MIVKTSAAVIAGSGLLMEWHALAAVPYADEESFEVSHDGHPYDGRIGDL